MPRFFDDIRFERDILVKGNIRYRDGANIIVPSGKIGVVVAAANSPREFKFSADYVCTGSTSSFIDHLTIQAAHDVLPVNGGGRIYLCPGDYYTSAKITVTTPNVTIEGAGWATIIHADAITGENELNSDGNVISVEGSADGCRVLNLKMDCMGTAQHGIVFNAVDYGEVAGCWVLDTVDDNGAGIKAMGSGAGTPCRWFNFHDNLLSDCCSSIALDYECQFGVIANNIIERGKGEQGSGISVDMLTASTGGQFLTITGNTVGTTYRGIVVLNANDCTITGNTVISESGAISGSRGISIGNSDRMVVCGNNIYGRAPGSDQGMILAGATTSIVVGNRLYNWTTGILGDANCQNNLIRNNYFETVTTILSTVTLANGNTVRQNVGHVTEASGTATVANGATTAVVTHGLGTTPALKDIQVTPTNNLGNAAKFWIASPTSTQFTITVDADPGATTATFVWQAAVY